MFPAYCNDPKYSSMLTMSFTSFGGITVLVGEHGGSVVERRTPERDVGGSKYSSCIQTVHCALHSQVLNSVKINCCENVHEVKNTNIYTVMIQSFRTDWS